MDPNNQPPVNPTPPEPASDAAALDAINKLDQEIPGSSNTPQPATPGVEPAVEQPAAANLSGEPVTTTPQPQPETQPVTPAAQPVMAPVVPDKKPRSSTKLLLIILGVAVLALIGFFVWQFVTTGSLL